MFYNKTNLFIVFVDVGWLNKVRVNQNAINEYAGKLIKSRPLIGDHKLAWLIKAVTCIDLTTLAGDDTNSNVTRLCFKVINHY